MNPMETDAFAREMLKQAQIGRLLRDSWRALGATTEHLGWGAKMAPIYSAPTTTANLLRKHMVPATGFGVLGAGAGAVQQARAAGNEGDPNIRSRVLHGALLGGLLGAGAGSQYYRWGRISAELAKRRSARLLKMYGTYAPEEVRVLQKVPGKLLPAIQGKEGIINPNVMRTGPLGLRKVEGLGNIVRHSAGQGSTTGQKVKNVLKTLHDQAQVRGYAGRGTLTQFVPNVLGGKLIYLPMAYGGAKAALSPQPGDSRAHGLAQAMITGVGGPLTHNAGMLLNMGTFLGPDLLRRSAAGAGV